MDTAFAVGFAIQVLGAVALVLIGLLLGVLLGVFVIVEVF